MKRFRADGWLEALAPLREAAVDLLRAEYGVVSSEVRSAGRSFLKAVLLLLVGLFALFWAIGAVALVVVEVAALWLPRWAAASTALALFVVVGLVLAAIARRKMKAIEPPAQTVKRRFGEHRDWWERKVVDARDSHRRRATAHRPEGGRLDRETKSDES